MKKQNHSIKSKMIDGYKTAKNDRFPFFSFLLDDEIRVFVEKDYGMWQVSVCRNWESPRNPGELLLDRRAFNVDENFKTIRWSDKVVDRAVELIETVIA